MSDQVPGTEIQVTLKIVPQHGSSSMSLYSQRTESKNSRELGRWITESQGAFHSKCGVLSGDILSSELGGSQLDSGTYLTQLTVTEDVGQTGVQLTTNDTGTYD